MLLTPTDIELEEEKAVSLIIAQRNLHETPRVANQYFLEASQRLGLDREKTANLLIEALTKEKAMREELRTQILAP